MTNSCSFKNEVELVSNRNTMNDYIVYKSAASTAPLLPLDELILSKGPPPVSKLI